MAWTGKIRSLDVSLMVGDGIHDNILVFPPAQCVGDVLFQAPRMAVAA